MSYESSAGKKMCVLTLSTPKADSVVDKKYINFLLFFPRNKVGQFMQIVL